ncbi:MAG TPA: DUF1622 domain-containing protein [Rubrobacteraceae bacterium]|jgi:uncharacterized membrane protein
MEAYQATLGTARSLILFVGSLIIVFGIARALPVARGPGGRVRVARQIGEHAALGLDYFVGATILNLALNPTWAAVGITALTIAIRKTLTFSLGHSVRSI